ncbi:HU family DNA-binding protein [Streptomyces murinus]|uniref:HU family DNA-binding protein n=1 Tax=Streptomyces murinus TaxID=33900 RepID=UPI000A23FC2E|nr:HU family DNA-binding protein [Streptomyces murinus]WDO09912.1 HU family DNA-binding protein [Streptomyces murinus]
MKKPTPIEGRLNTTRLIEVVAADCDIPLPKAQEIVMATFDAIARAAASGHDVAVVNFGTWLSYRAAPRTARNPQHGTPVAVPAHQKVRFRVSPQLADAVRRGDLEATIRKAPRGSKSPAQTAATTSAAE